MGKMLWVRMQSKIANTICMQSFPKQITAVHGQQSTPSRGVGRKTTGQTDITYGWTQKIDWATWFSSPTPSLQKENRTPIPQSRRAALSPSTSPCPPQIHIVNSLLLLMRPLES